MLQYGVRGQYQAGIDIYLRLRSGVYECRHCKSGSSFGASQLREAVRAFETGEWME